MKTVLIAVSVALATACGGSSGTTDKLANFTGSGWNASVTTTISASCPVLPGHSENRTYSITFAPTTGADLQWTSAEGCLYKFNVAALALAANDSTALATTTDGRNLTIATAGTASAIGQTCPFAEAGSATR